jgi:hypothetical protein
VVATAPTLRNLDGICPSYYATRESHIRSTTIGADGTWHVVCSDGTTLRILVGDHIVDLTAARAAAGWTGYGGSS